MRTREQEPIETKNMPYSVRPMLPEDSKAVAAIEMEAFPTTWPPTPFRKELNNRLARYLVAYIHSQEATEDGHLRELASVHNDSLLNRILQGVWPKFGLGSSRDTLQSMRLDNVLGYLGMWFMADEAHITAIAVREPYQRRGIGELLLISCVELAILRHADVVTLEVRVSNTLAQKLYKKYGFEIVGTRKKYYTDDHEDAFIMTTGKIQESHYQGMLQKKVAAHSNRWGVSNRILAVPSSSA